MRLHDDEGVALVTVLGALSVLTILVTGLLAYGTTSLRQAAIDEDTTGAMAAAEAGIDDFLHRLNRDSDYWQEADPDWNGGGGVPDPDNDALQPGVFAAVPGPASRGSFSYSVDASSIAADGNVVVTSTGRANGRERTVRAVLRRRGFLDYLYFTDFEIIDPSLQPQFTTPEERAACARHEYATSPARPSSCTQIYWADDDVVSGPFHTNDTIWVTSGASPEWTDPRVTTSWTGDGTKHWKGTGGAAPVFVGGDAQYDEPLEMPPSNDAIKAQADPSVGGEGCLYAGPTYIKLEGDQMRVTSQLTDEADPPGATVCKVNGGTQPIPDNGVIFVRNLAPGEADSAKPHPYPVSFTGRSDTWREYLSGVHGESVFDARSGDVYIEGNLDGRLTVAAENDVVFVGDVCYATCADLSGRSVGGDDLLGVVANNFVEVYHPVRWSDANGDGNAHYWSGGVRYPESNEFSNLVWKGGDVWRDVRIDAAILSVEHSFRVQYHRVGPQLDTLDVQGAIAQVFRGAVGTTSPTGYAKRYAYDERLRFQSPPHFLDPVRSAWVATQWSIERSS